MNPPKLILVSPKGEGNLGSVARLMLNFGLGELRIVDPRCNLKGDEVKKMSLEAYEIVERASIFKNLEDAIADCETTIAFTARLAGENPPAQKLECAFEPELFVSAAALVFGREDNGLEIEELRLCTRQVSIPTDRAKTSLNLASSAAIVLYEYFKKAGVVGAAALASSDSEDAQRPKSADCEIFFRQLQDLLSSVGFLKGNSDTHVLEDLRDMFHRADVRQRDLRILFGIVSDLSRVLKPGPR